VRALREMGREKPKDGLGEARGFLQVFRIISSISCTLASLAEHAKAPQRAVIITDAPTPSSSPMRLGTPNSLDSRQRPR
jgi:hypothetical protein